MRGGRPLDGDRQSHCRLRLDRPGRCSRNSRTQSGHLRRLDAELTGDSLNLALFENRHPVLGRRDRKQASQQRQLLVAGRLLRELAGHEKVVGAAEQQVARLRQADDEHGLIRRKLTFLLEEALHRPGLLRAHGLIGVRHASEEIGETRQIPRALRFQLVEGVEQATERGMVALTLVLLNPQPRPEE